MKLGALLKWGHFNKRERFRMGGTGSLYSEMFFNGYRKQKVFTKI
jgi:hypothetical protein